MEDGSISEHPLVQDDSSLRNGDLTNGIPMTKVQTSNSLRPRRTVTSTSASEASSTSGGVRFNLKRAASSMFKPEQKVGQAPGVLACIRSIIFASWLNVLLVFIPVSWALHFADPDQHTLIFIFSFLAKISLAKLLDFAVDELSLRVGQTLATLLSISFGNTVELIVAIIALTHCELGVVQSSLIGSILSNLLLGLGICFFAGGVKFSEQGFGASATQLNSSLLTISVIAVLLPTAFRFSVTTTSDPVSGQDILRASHGAALVLLFIYGSYLFFQLYSHATLYGDKSDDIIKSTKYAPREKKVKDGDRNSSTVFFVVETTKEEEEEEVIPQLSLFMSFGLLAVVAVVVAVTAEWLVDSIDGLTKGGVISKEFVGIILLPIVGNAAEHATAASVSVKDELNLILGTVVGSSIQIALCVIPSIVTLAWMLGKPLTMLFDPFQSSALFLAVLTVNYAVQDGKSNWMKGIILICLYLILGTTFWFYPGTADEFTDILPLCE
ncbi:Calcium/proton exchanger [Mycena latifolia]|nr:Calcium/proton exchanger [Mycena latifolia]